MLPVGNLANAAAIVFGGALGLVLQSRLPERMRIIVFQGLGLCVMVLGMDMALQFDSPLIPIFSIALGGIIGEVLRLEDRCENLAAWLKRTVRSNDARFVDGAVTASVIYCVGSMGVLGAFAEGLRGDPAILLTKAMLDGFASIAFAASYGVGVLFSAIPVFIYQFSLTLFASGLQDVFDEALIQQLTATGGVLILGIGLNLLEVTRIKLTNMLPSLVIVVVLTLFLN